MDTILTLSQPYDLSKLASDWTPPVDTPSASTLTFTSGSQQLLFDSRGVWPISALSYQDGQMRGIVYEIQLSDAGNPVMSLRSAEPWDPFTVDGSGGGGTLAQWLTLSDLFGRDDQMTGSSGNDVLLGYGGNDTIQAGAGNDRVDAGAGDDSIVDGAGNDSIDGGAGFDTATWSGALADYTVKRSGSVFTVTNVKDGSVDTVTNVERMDFSDKFVAADVASDTPGGAVFRLYQAAFDRAPDADGLLFWTRAVGDQGAKLDAVADAFIGSTEYQARYGTGLSNHDLVAKYYQNVLHRTADQGGLDFWTAALDNHTATNAQVLAAISDSPENVAGTAALIANGLVLDYPIMT